jgi:hypothetical protein
VREGPWVRFLLQALTLDHPAAVVLEQLVSVVLIAEVAGVAAGGHWDLRCQAAGVTGQKRGDLRVDKVSRE